MISVPLKQDRIGRVYLAGPMSGIADNNAPAFNAEADRLRAEGFAVINPADCGVVAGAEWEDYLRYTIAAMMGCERIHLLDGWEKSRGATLEVRIAMALHMDIGFATETTCRQLPEVHAANIVEALHETKPFVTVQSGGGHTPAKIVMEFREGGLDAAHLVYTLLVTNGSCKGTTQDRIANAIRDVAELPDRNSPPDMPDAMLVTREELFDILRRYFLLDVLQGYFGRG